MSDTITPHLATARAARETHLDTCLRCNRGPHTWLECPVFIALDDLIDYEEHRVREAEDRETLAALAAAEDPALATAKAVAEKLTAIGRDATQAWARYEHMLDARRIARAEAHQEAERIELDRPAD